MIFLKNDFLFLTDWFVTSWQDRQERESQVDKTRCEGRKCAELTWWIIDLVTGSSRTRWWSDLKAELLGPKCRSAFGYKKANNFKISAKERIGKAFGKSGAKHARRTRGSVNGTSQMKNDE